MDKNIDIVKYVVSKNNENRNKRSDDPNHLDSVRDPRETRFSSNNQNKIGICDFSNNKSSWGSY